MDDTDANVRHCASCGTRWTAAPGETALTCPTCGGRPFGQDHPGNGILTAADVAPFEQRRIG